MMIEKNRYPFIIMNMDQSDKNGMHWRSFLDLHPTKEIFLFDRFGFEGFKEFTSTTTKKLLTKFYSESKN